MTCSPNNFVGEHLLPLFPRLYGMRRCMKSEPVLSIQTDKIILNR